MGANQTLHMSYAEYLAFEATSDVKHEYLCGEVWARAGGTLEHARLQAIVIYELGKALLRKPCVVFTSDARLRVVSTDRSTYPDVSVVCGKVVTAPDDRHALTNPSVIVEVLSDSTEADDRGEKFAHYRRIASLREYVLVGQRTPRIEVYRREGEHWILIEAGPGQRVHLASIDCGFAVDNIYRDPLAAAERRE